MAKVRWDVDEQGRQAATVVLSERNLLTLLTKLYTPGATPAVTWTSGDGAVHLLVAQDDRTHYGDLDRGRAAAGSMHPVVESIVAQLRVIGGDLEAESRPTSDAPDTP